MKVRDRRDFAAGLLIAAIGAVFAVVAGSYPLGTAESMGPGYVPLALGVMVLVMGAIIVARSMSRNAPLVAAPSIPWRMLLFVVVPVVVFGLVVSRLGLAISLFLVVAISSLARKDFSLRSMLLVAVTLVTGGIVLFVWMLGMLIPVWPSIG